MRWLSSRSNRAREEMATTRRFSRLCAMSRFPIEETLEQGKIERHSNTPRLHALHQRGVSFQLRRIALPLPLQESLQVGAGVPAGLVVHDPAHAVPVHEGPVDDSGLETPLLQEAQSVFAARLRVRLQQPAPAFVLEGIA